MNSSRTTTIGIVLILLIFFGWMIFNQPKPQPKPAAKPAAVDTAVAKRDTIAPASVPSVSAIVKVDTLIPEVTKKVTSPIIDAVISSKGGTLKQWICKHYLTWDKQPLDLVNQSAKPNGDINLRFVAADGKTVSTADLDFTLDNTDPLILQDYDTVHITLTAQLDSGSSIRKILTIVGNEYLVGIEYQLTGMQSKVTGYRYSLDLVNELPFAEEHPDQEASSARAFITTAGGHEVIDAHDPAEPQRKTINGDVLYVASRTKYFVQALIPVLPRPVSAEVLGKAKPLAGGHHTEVYSLGVTMPIANADRDTISSRLYLGPLEYNRISELKPPLDETMDFGWSFLVRPISIHLLYPIFMFLHSFISNWGLVIIVFSIIAKLLTYPLSTGQMKSMRKMQAVMPEINALKDKYKDDPKKLQQETFAVYRSYGVNPAGGCLPLLLQMPILFALYSVLVNVIELRQAPFMFWITDLSVPDRLIDFGKTSIPLLGNHISGLTVMMTITMIIQSIATVTDERQKKMAYIMPILFMFLFNNLPSGVALYYFMFNIFGIAQQLYNKKFLPPLSLEQLKEDAKNKKGFMARMQDLEKSTRAQRQAQMMGGATPKKKGKKK
jgi:YidC/Oxa1 family membrane protein insertase